MNQRRTRNYVYVMGCIYEKHAMCVHDCLEHPAAIYVDQPCYGYFAVRGGECEILLDVRHVIR